MKTSVKRLCLTALFCALCALGANIRLVSSVALDALPAFLCAFLLGPLPGAAAGFFGHLLTALLSGFPLSLPLHLIVALEMAGICFAAGFFSKNGRLFFPAAASFFLNAFVSPLVLLFFPNFGPAAYLALLPGLVAGSAVNAFGAALLAKILKDRLPDFRRK